MSRNSSRSQSRPAHGVIDMLLVWDLCEVVQGADQCLQLMC